MARGSGAELQELRGTPSLDHYRGAFGFLLWQLSWHRALRNHFAKPDAPGCDVVHVLYLDDFDKAAAVLGSPFGRKAFTGLLMNVRFHHARMAVPRSRSRWDPVYGLLFRRLIRLRELKVLCSTDPVLETYSAGRYQREWRKVKSVPDFGSPVRKRDRAHARSALGIPSEACVVLVYGTLTNRKGLHMLNAALTHPACPDRVIGLVAGRTTASGRSTTESESARTLRERGRLLLVDRFLSENEEGDAFAAADLVWLGYEHFFALSGVLFQALQTGRPVLAQDYGLIAWLVGRHRLGIVGDTRDPLTTATALADFAANPAAYQLQPDALASCLGRYNERAHSDGVVESILSAVNLKRTHQAAAIPPPPVSEGV